MSDIADKAQELIELQLQSNLNKVMQQQDFQPSMNTEGKRICIDCDRLIPAARLVAVPKAVRCIGCQRDMEDWK